MHMAPSLREFKISYVSRHNNYVIIVVISAAQHSSLQGDLIQQWMGVVGDKGFLRALTRKGVGVRLGEISLLLLGWEHFIC